MQAMILDTYMQIMNHWQSNAYQHYIKTPPTVSKVVQETGDQPSETLTWY